MTITTLLLDRDGVINFDSPNYIKTPDEWKPIPGSLQAIAYIHQSGVKIGVATNQRGLALGLYDESSLQAIHEKMLKQIRAAGGDVDALIWCPHDSHEGCSCRKPAPGMLLHILNELQQPKQQALMVGDKLSDIEAARAAGVRAALVLTGNGQDTLYKHQETLRDTPVFADLAALVLAFKVGTL